VLSWRPRRLLQVSPNNPARFHPISRHFFSPYGNCCMLIEIIICLCEVSKNGMENKYCGRVVDTCMDRFGSVSLQRKWGMMEVNWSALPVYKLFVETW
jgi:hypothetical protein